MSIRSASECLCIKDEIEILQINKNLKVALETKNTIQIENGSLGFIESLHKQ